MITITENWLRQMPLPHTADGDKRARGNTLIVGGPPGVPGAVLLAGLGSLSFGAGRLQIATPGTHAGQLGLAIPEALVLGLSERTAFNAVGSELAELVKRAKTKKNKPGFGDIDQLSN